MLLDDPANTMVMFGLAKEYEKSGQTAEMIETLERYLAVADDDQIPPAIGPEQMVEVAWARLRRS